jgi:hypothetical protein
VWRTLLRDVLAPLVGLGICVHEVLVASEPRYLAVVLGLVLLGIPVDAAVKALSGWRGLPPPNSPPNSPPPTPPRAPSSPEPSSGGSSPADIERIAERIADAAADA